MIQQGKLKGVFKVTLTLENSLKRKSIDCFVETKKHWYAGNASYLLKEIPAEDLKVPVRAESCFRMGNQRQWEIFADK